MPNIKLKVTHDSILLKELEVVELVSIIIVPDYNYNSNCDVRLMMYIMLVILLRPGHSANLFSTESER